MPELELTRTPDDRRLYAIAGVGTLRFRGTFTRSATAEAGDRRWHISRRGFWRPVLQASNPAGAVIGEYRGRTLRRGGELRWSEHSFTLRASSVWRERYALAEGERELATIEGKGWGKHPVKLTVEDHASAIDPGLLLFAAYVVRTLAEESETASTSSMGT